MHHCTLDIVFLDNEEDIEDIEDIDVIEDIEDIEDIDDIEDIEDAENQGNQETRTLLKSSNTDLGLCKEHSFQIEILKF